MLLRYLRSNFLFWFGVIFGVVGLAVFAAAMILAGQTARRQKGYYPVTAITIGTHIYVSVSGGDTHYIDFRYTDRTGRSHEGSANTSRKEFKETRPGQPFEVNVSEVNPADAWPARQGAPTYLLSWMVALMGSVFFVPGAIVALRQLRRILRGVAALERGQYVVGRVENIVTTHENVNWRPLYRVAWSWQGLDGKRRRGESLSLSKNAATHWKKGDEIAAYIHPSDPEFAEADFFGYRSR